MDTALVERLEEVVARISPVDGKSARRLGQLADMLELPDCDRKETVDLYGAISPASVEESAFRFYQKRPWWFSGVEWARNVLILVPILLTWFGLWRASADYARLIRLEPDLIRQPFLLLWEQGFPELGSGARLKFSQVAFLDVLLLFGVLALTALVHFYRDVREANAERQARELRQEVEDVLWEVDKLLAERRHSQSQGAALSQFDKSARILIRHLEDERERLAELGDQRQKEFDDLAALSGSLITGAEKLQKFSENVQEVYDPLQGAIQKLGGHVAAVGEQQGQLRETMGTLNDQMNGLMSSVMQAGQSINSAADELGDSVDRISDYVGLSKAGFHDVRELLDDMSHRFDRITHNLQEATGNAGGVSRIMNDAMSSLNQASQTLIPALGAFSQETTALTDRLSRAVSDLEQSGQSLLSAANGLGNSADRILTYAEASTTHFQNVSEWLDDLTRRLDAITNNLEKATSDAGTFSTDASSIMASLSQAGQDFAPALRVFSQETRQTSERLAEAASILEQSAGHGQTSRPLSEWLVIALALAMLAGISLVTTAQAFGFLG